MKKIGVTQRVYVDQHTSERRDCLDQRWAQFLTECGLIPIILPNTGPSADLLATDLALDGVLLTGGNDIEITGSSGLLAPERDAFEFALVEHCLRAEIPIFAVCRGLQVLNLALGGSVSAVENHVAIRHIVFRPETEQRREVNSFHNYGIFDRDLSPSLQADWCHEDGTIEAVTGRTAIVKGLMWHPEREQPFLLEDKELIVDFFS